MWAPRPRTAARDIKTPPGAVPYIGGGGHSGACCSKRQRLQIAIPRRGSGIISASARERSMAWFTSFCHLALRNERRADI